MLCPTDPVKPHNARHATSHLQVMKAPMVVIKLYPILEKFRLFLHMQYILIIAWDKVKDGINGSGILTENKTQ